MNKMNDLRNLPSVEKLIQNPEVELLIQNYGREQTIKGIRETLENIRKDIKSGKSAPSSSKIVQEIRSLLTLRFNPTLIPVINATGVILHTNLGRAPLSQETLQAMQTVGINYNTLEFNLGTGKRGTRSTHAEEILKQLTGTESALIVNNNAAAVLLVLSALANRRKVVIARSQLIEIGGGFRIPDVMRQSGAKLVEVGTTNKIRASDYENALQESAALVMRAHHSNFKILGFTEEPSLTEIVNVSHHQNIPVLDDLGSGTFMETAQFGLIHEPTILESVHAGADIITFSGDKLLGGPQAGIIIGKKDLLQKIRKHPLARAIRPDKVTLAGLTATLTHYLREEALEKIPIWKMISSTPESILQRVKTWQKELGFGEVTTSTSTIGGGSLPEEVLPTFVLAMQVPKPDVIMKKLRDLEFPIIARVENDKIMFDPRTVLLEQDPLFLRGLKSLRIEQ